MLEVSYFMVMIAELESVLGVVGRLLAFGNEGTGGGGGRESLGGVEGGR